jgi:serine/threonine-protein kinase
VGQRRPVAISPDGARLIVEQVNESGDYDLMSLPLDGASASAGQTPSALQPLVTSPYDERNPSISPDGHWIAYESNQTGQYQIYVRPHPAVNDAVQQVSTAGGRTPLFAPNGRELFFVNGSALLAVPIQLAPTFRAGNPTALFNAPSAVVLDARRIANSGRTYEVSSDGTRFLMLKDDEAEVAQRNGQPNVIIVQHWLQELKSKLSAAK